MQQKTFGSLNCRIVGEPENARLTVFMCHGYGAPGTDLVSLGAAFQESSDDLRDNVAFVFPEAPISLDAEGIPGGLAWWPLNMARLQQVMQTRDWDKLTQAEPPGLIEMRTRMLEFLDRYREQYGVAIEHCVLGGFSQGAMLMTEVALNLPETPAGLCLYSGTLLSADRWRELAKQRAGLQVLQSHGTVDPILPFPVAEQLRDLLQEAGLHVTFLPFVGPHTIPMQVLELTGRFLSERL